MVMNWQDPQPGREAFWTATGRSLIFRHGRQRLRVKTQAY
jgi:hypothetical protein